MGLKRRPMIVSLIAMGFLAAPVAVAQSETSDYEPAPHGTRWLEGLGGLAIKILVEEENLGGTEVEIGEITFPAGSPGGTGHTHGSTEIFYVLSGELEHVVDGKSHVLKPGMVGIVRPGSKVVHRVRSKDTPVKALVIWAPGGEAERLAPFFQQRPVESGSP